MTSDEDRIEDLKFFGYSAREARFLYLTAIYSGYFIRRQYRRFTGLSGGSPDDLLVRKVLALKHDKRYPTCRRTYLYHLCARPFYNAIGQLHNRHRRRRPAFAIKTKLMALDYVLDNRNEKYLATDEEKVDYFHEERGIPLTQLPAKTYPHPRTSRKTRRFFVETFPIFIDGNQDSSNPMVSFCYIDEGVHINPGI